MIALLTFIKIRKTNILPSSDIIYNLMWGVLFVLVLILGLNGYWMIKKTVLWIIKPGMIDMKMYVAEKGTRKKPEVLNINKDALWIPRY